MALRPVFEANQEKPYVRNRSVEFEFHPGFSIQQKQRSIESLHHAYLLHSPESNVLEVSSKSTSQLGVQLSSFNLMITHSNGRRCSVESAFQASKVFEDGGPYADLLRASSKQAKKDSRLRTSGKLLGFQFFDRKFPLEPKSYFYDWLYASALFRNKRLLEEVLHYVAFTDIEFNLDKSINCQARSVAKVVGLCSQDLLDQALSDPESFCRIGYLDHSAEDATSDEQGAVEEQGFLF